MAYDDDNDDFGVVPKNSPQNAKSLQDDADRTGSWTEEEIRTLVSMWRENRKNVEIAKTLNRSQNAISVKASRIGLPPKEKIPEAVSSNMKVRACLKCRGKFFSEGAGNRICSSCKNSDDWKSGGGYSIIS